ncbi:MAG TPA: serine--tRNA ligase [Acidimicrobiales bacterium]|nr:serine--tRNA ligase [Acidimicrobiales bacterium]
MIDLAQLRREPDVLKAALGRRGISSREVDEIVALDVEHRRLLQESERLRAEVKELSRRVGAARREKDLVTAEELASTSRGLGDDERQASEATELVGSRLRDLLLLLPNLPDPRVPDGADENDNVEVRRWWVGMDEGAPFPTFADHQRVAHWDIGRDLGILDMESGAKLAGSMFPLYRGAGSRLIRALAFFALDQHADAYEEIRPPSVALTDTMMSTGHLPKSADDMYAIERDDLWLIPTAEVPLTSLHRGEILNESALPVRLTAFTPCFRREAGAAGKDTRGLLRVHEFDKVELFAYCTPAQADEAQADILRRAEGILQALGLTYRVLDLCAGDLGTASAYTIDLEVFSPGVDRWLEVSSVSWFRDFQARRANVRYRTSDGSTAFVHTVNGSALAWARIWAALVETYRQEDGSVRLPAVLAPYFGGDPVLRATPS